MARLRPETKIRARALQLLYAWDLQGRPPVDDVAANFFAAGRVPYRSRATRLANRVAAQCDRLDGEIESAIEGWRLERVGIVERNILRMALVELLDGETPVRVVIDEAVRLAQWFAGPKAPSFVNGVLDALARQHHCL